MGMPKAISIKKNYFYSTFYQILTIVTPLITAPYTARVFGADGIGIQSYTNSIASYFLIFAALGTAVYGQFEIAQHRDNPKESTKLFWEIELLSVVTTIICTIGWIFWICISTKYSAYYAVLTITLVAVAFDISWYFSGFEQFKYIVIRNTIFKILGIICLFTFVHKKNDLLLYMGLLGATGLLGNLSMWTYLPKFLVKIDFRTLRIKRHVKETFVYFIPSIATSVYTIFDKTMIGLITNSSAENGYYEQATKIVNMAKTLILSLNTVMFARMSYLFSEGKVGEVKSKIDQSLNFTCLLGLSLTFGIIGVAQNFVPWFFGPGYNKVIILLWVMSPLICIIGISNCLGSQYLTPSGQRAKSNKGIVAGAIVNVISNIFLIPRLASVGAAISSLIAETVIMVIYVHMSKGFTNWKNIWHNIWKRMVAGTAMLLAVLFIGRTSSGLFWITFAQIGAGAAVYVLILILLRDNFILDYLQRLQRKFRQE